METFFFSIDREDPNAALWRQALMDSAMQVGATLLGSERRGTTRDVYTFDKDIPQELIIENAGRSAVFQIKSAPRRPAGVRVRSHVRRRIVHHLENPPPYCACNYSKTVDRVRRGAIRRLK